MKKGPVKHRFSTLIQVDLAVVFLLVLYYYAVKFNELTQWQNMGMFFAMLVVYAICVVFIRNKVDSQLRVFHRVIQVGLVLAVAFAVVRYVLSVL